MGLGLVNLDQIIKPKIYMLHEIVGWFKTQRVYDGK